MKKLQDDPDYKKTVAAYMAAYRQQKAEVFNSTVQGRKRIFNESVKHGPIFVCISCKRCLFNNAVIPISYAGREKFRVGLNSIEDNLFEETIKDFQQSETDSFLCLTCKKHLFKGDMPPMCHSNDLATYNYEENPGMKLSELENSLIAKDLLFMKIVQLPRSRMAALRGQEVNIPLTDVDIKNTVKQLPRTPDEASVIPVQLKRKQAYRNAHLKEYISPSKIKQALSTFKLLGHRHYQFDFESDFDDFEKRMEIEAEQLQKDDDLP